jgi:hypothetical protein
MAGGWPWRHDLRRVTRGLAAMLRTARAAAPETGIGTLAAAAPVARVEGDNRYSITLACTVPRPVRLVVDIHGVDGAGVPGAHLAHAATHLQLTARRALRVDIAVRWREAVTFEFEGEPRPAHELWVGAPAGASFISVAADLQASDGRCLERILIFQKVEEPACG